jgi:hypothetical protein
MADRRALGIDINEYSRTGASILNWSRSIYGQAFMIF